MSTAITNATVMASPVVLGGVGNNIFCTSQDSMESSDDSLVFSNKSGVLKRSEYTANRINGIIADVSQVESKSANALSRLSKLEDSVDKIKGGFKKIEEVGKAYDKGDLYMRWVNRNECESDYESFSESRTICPRPYVRTYIGKYTGSNSLEITIDPTYLTNQKRSTDFCIVMRSNSDVYVTFKGIDIANGDGIILKTRAGGYKGFAFSELRKPVGKDAVPTYMVEPF